MSKLVVLDLETYYDREFSLSKISTEEYVRSPLYETIGIAIKINGGETQWYPQPEVEAALKAIDWSDAIVVAQNTMFDGAILKWRYGVDPMGWVDIMGMSRALYPHEKSHSLKTQAERAGVGQKGDEVIHALGKRYKDFDAEALARYGAYCCLDVDLTHTLFVRYMQKGFPRQELKLLDLTLRMYIDAVLELDAELLKDHLHTVKLEKEALLNKLNADDKARLMSNPQLAEMLRERGVEPPMKVSPTTGKQTYAFAKTDEAFKALLEHEDLEVQAIVAARLGVKSTLEETRTERFIDMAHRGKFPVPLRYYGAHSGRWSGDQSVNLQNLPSRGANAGKIKRSVKPPPGYVFIDSDSAQIEARTLAWLAGQDDLVKAFEQKKDVYRIMASHIYGIAPDQISKEQRFIGKTTVLGCIAEGELVLTDVGLVPIQLVSTSMRVWDGVEWVRHEGPIFQGEQEVLTYDSLTATPDHIVYLQDGSTCRFDVAAETSLSIAHTGYGGVPLRYGGDHINRSDPTRDKKIDLHTREMHTLSYGEMDKPHERTSRAYERLSAVQPTEDDTRVVGQTGHRHETEMYQPSAYELEALRGPGGRVSFPVCERSRYLDHEESGTAQRTGAGSYKYERALRAGESCMGYEQREQVTYKSNETRSSISRVQTTASGSAVCGRYATENAIKDDRRGNSSEMEHPVMQTKRRVWDLLNAGPRHRFTVSGRLVSNCGYGVGFNKLKLFLKTGAGVDINEAEAKRIVDTYRKTYYRIPQLWEKADSALVMLASGLEFGVDVRGIVRSVPNEGLSLPNGLYIRYPGLRQVASEKGGLRWVYDSRGQVVDVYGGKCLSADTEVLTERGWVRIVEVKTTDRVWDGIEWVNHHGLTYQGYKPTIVLNGVRMTADHKVLTSMGWRDASSCERLHGTDFWMPDGSAVRGSDTTFSLGVPMHMWNPSYTRSNRRREVRQTRGDFVVRLSDGQESADPCNVKTSSLLGLAVNAGSLQATHPSGMAQLWGAWDNCVRSLGSFVRKILGGYGSYLSTGANARSYRQQPWILTKELSLGTYGGTGWESTRRTSGGYYESSETNRGAEINPFISMASEPVYDLINAGPRSRFVVRGDAEPFIVHNCVENFTQAIARCIIAEQMLRIAKRYKVVLTVHDAIGCIAPVEEQEEAVRFVDECMSWRPTWAAGLPLACEVGWGASYGDC